jgi:hypothetical protein
MMTFIRQVEKVNYIIYVINSTLIGIPEICTLNNIETFKAFAYIDDLENN